MLESPLAGREIVKKLLGNLPKQLMGNGLLMTQVFGTMLTSSNLHFFPLYMWETESPGVYPGPLSSPGIGGKSLRRRKVEFTPVFSCRVSVSGIKHTIFWGLFSSHSTFQDPKWEAEAQREKNYFM